MPDEFTRYLPVETGIAPGTVAGQLPNDQDAEAFRYWKTLDAFVSFGSLIWGGGLGSATLSGDWEIKIRDSPGGAVIFHQKVTIRFFILAMGEPGAPTFATWNPVLDGGSGTGVFESYILDGQSVPQDGGGHYEGWRFIDTAHPTIYSEFGIFDPGATPIYTEGVGTIINTADDAAAELSYTDDGVHIVGQWLSPAYRMNVPAGSVLEIVTDHWGTGIGLRESLFAFSLREIGGLDVWLDDVNALRLAMPRAGGTDVIHRYRVPAGSPLVIPTRRAIIPGLKQATVCKTGDNMMWWLGDLGGVGAIFYSEDDGFTVARDMTRSTTGQETPTVAFGSGYKLFHQCPAGNGGRHMVAQKGGFLWYANSERPELAIKVGPVVKSGRYCISAGTQLAADGEIIISNLDSEYYSSDGRGPWQHRTA